MNLKELISALPETATSPYAFVAYIVLVLGWLVISLKVRRNRHLLKHLSTLPEKDRLKALELEMGAVRIRHGLTAEQWIKSRVHLYVFLAFVMTSLVVVVLFVVAHNTTVITQNGQSNKPTSEKYSDVIQNFEYEATEIIKHYQWEYRRFPFDDDKGEPNHTELQEYVSLVDKYIDLREKFPIQSALLWRLWGVRRLTDEKIRPKERIKLAVPYFKKSIEYHPDQEDLKTATKDLEFSITPGNEVEEGKIDAMPFMYYRMLLSKGHHCPSLEDFRREFKEDPYRAFGVSPLSDEEIALRNDKEWLFSYATRTPIKDALAQLDREVHMKQGKRTNATIQMYRDENQHTIIEAEYPNLELKWKVDIAAKRYNSLNKETEAFMLNYVHAAPNTFSESFDIDGKNKPVINFVKGEIHSYTNYAMTWWLDEAAPEGLESFLAGISLSKTEFQNREEMIGKKVDINFVLSWLADDILEVKFNKTADIGFGQQDFNYVWHISPIKKKYVSISQDAKLYDLTAEIKKLRN
jgi:hypothetical protein